MGKISESKNVHPFVALLYQKEEYYQKALEKCKHKLGPVLDSSQEYNFSKITSYYNSEMGKNLQKRLLVFQEYQNLEDFHKIKLWSNQVEQELSQKRENRKINIDPGYLGLSKLVLFSTKNYSHRIYINDGIYAEVTLIYENGGYKAQSWTYPDYNREATLDFLEESRQKIKQRARNKGYMLDLD